MRKRCDEEVKTRQLVGCLDSKTRRSALLTSSSCSSAGQVTGSDKPDAVLPARGSGITPGPAAEIETEEGRVRPNKSKTTAR
ncbi:hypothetical protein ACQKWADRAFT_302544 [Trichoderma austrokoningii]